MRTESEQVTLLLAFFALPPQKRIDAIVASGWVEHHDLEERTTTKQLLRQLELATDTMKRYEPWWDILDAEGVDAELESLLSLIFVVSGQFPYVERRLFDSVEAMETEPEWRLVWRLVVRLAELLNITASVEVSDVPALICGDLN